MKTEQSTLDRQKKITEETYLTIRETADFLSMSVSSIVKMLRDKQLPFAVFGKNSRRIPKSGLLKYAKDRMVK
jgi:excisionase family DNA binding protein